MAIRRYAVLKSYVDFNNAAHLASLSRSALSIEVREEMDELSDRRTSSTARSDEIVLFDVLSIERALIGQRLIVHCQIRQTKQYVMIVASEEAITYEVVS